MKLNWKFLVGEGGFQRRKKYGCFLKHIFNNDVFLSNKLHKPLFFITYT